MGCIAESQNLINKQLELMQQCVPRTVSSFIELCNSACSQLSESEFATPLSPSARVDEGDITVSSKFSHYHETAASFHSIVNSREPSFNLNLLICNANNPVNLLQNPIIYLANLNEVVEQFSKGIMTYPLAIFDQLLDDSERSLKRILDKITTVSESSICSLILKCALPCTRHSIHVLLITNV